MHESRDTAQARASCCESDQPESVEAEKTWDAARLNFARELCEFLIWDPSLQGRPRFSADAMEMLEMVGRVLDKATRVKTIACDNATQHSLIKAMLLGLPTGLSQARILSLPFWKDIAYVPLPESCLPRCNFRKPVIQREVLFLLIGPAHLQKNVVGQLRSPKTIRYGRFFCDWSATLDLSMPPGAYQGYEFAIGCGGSILLECIPPRRGPALKPRRDPHPMGAHRCSSPELDSLPHHRCCFPSWPQSIGSPRECFDWLCPPGLRPDAS